MKHTAYPQYKPSGVEYLGDVPAEWAVQRIKHVLENIYSGGTPDTGNEVFWSDDDSGIPWVAIADMTAARNLKSTAKKITEEGKQSKQLPILPRGTILYSMYASLGKVTVLEIPAVVNQAILGMVPATEKLTRDYLAYWLRNMERHIFLMSSSNTQSNLNAEKVRNMPIYLPSLAEQKDIVKFLDLETGKTDALVEKKRMLVARLKEKRGALISRAVTRGLDPDAPMKDSGVEYLGDVPAHWDVRRLKTVSHIHASSIDRKTRENETTVRFLGTDTVYETERITKNTPLESASATDADIQCFALRRGDVIVTKDSVVPTRIAIPAIVTENLPDLSVCGYHMVLLRPIKDLLISEYLFRVLSTPALAGHFLSLSRGTTIIGLGQGALGCAPFPLPPLSEQTAIANFLDRETEKIDALIAKVEETIERLKEHRAALISAAVTGQIDVRAAK